MTSCLFGQTTFESSTFTSLKKPTTVFTGEIVTQGNIIGQMVFPNFSFEKKIWAKGNKNIVGLDEVGRGSLAGPVVCGGVVFPANANLRKKAKNLGVEIDDSKKLTARQRGKADVWIRQNALAVAVSSISAKKIDRVGISKATHSGFRRAVKGIQEQLTHPVNFVLIDAFYIPHLRNFPLLSGKARQLAIIDGDAKSFTIAAASIVAKVYRDNLMKKLGRGRNCTKFGWEKNKGYGTKIHLDALKKYGISRYHRRSFLNNFFSSQVRLNA